MLMLRSQPLALKHLMHILIYRLFKYLREMLMLRSQPLPLKHLMRIFIRRHCRNRLRSFAAMIADAKDTDEVEIPHSLLNFILMQH